LKVELNGSVVELDPGASVRDAALTLATDPSGRGVAVAVDGEVVPRSEIESTPLREGQRVEVVTAIQGGAV